jgi:glutathione S-transferase
MAIYRLYNNLSSGNAYKVRLLLTLLELPFERVEMDIDRNRTRTPEFLAINMNGRVPVLRLPDGRHLAESNAILWYLAAGSEFIPADRFDQAEMLQWLCFEQYSHEPNIATLRFWRTHHVEMTPERVAAVPGKRSAGLAALDVMERHLATRRWFAGDAFSIADIALYAYTHVAEEGQFALAPYPNIGAWLARVAARPRHVPITESFASATLPEGTI